MNFIKWAAKISPTSWSRLNDLNPAKCLGTCLTLITGCSADFIGPKCFVEIQPYDLGPAWGPWLASCGKLKAKNSWRGYGPQAVCPALAMEITSSARQMNEWLLKHIKLNSNWRHNTPSSKLEHSRSCFMSHSVVSAVAGWQLPSGEWSRWCRGW